LPEAFSSPAPNANVIMEFGSYKSVIDEAIIL
jgi:hypothetical protein